MVTLTRGLATILTVNAGSSSLKCALFAVGDGEPERLASLIVPRLDLGELVVQRPGCDERRRSVGPPGSNDPHAERHSAISAVLEAVTESGLPQPGTVVHRFVHGGPTLLGPTALDEATLHALRELTSWAPLHQPAALAGVEAVADRLADVAQIGCFDTSFHRTLPEVAQRLPLPDWTWKAGIRRYGFHGLSYEHVVTTIGPARLGRAVIAHLGNGSSLAAIADGRSIDTTMGFTPDGGVVMGSRTGDLDPGVLLHLLDDGLSAADLRSTLEEHGGLRGLSGGTADMQTLLARRQAGDAPAALAVETYCRRIRMQVGAYSALLGGIDTLVFTGGIGEHAAQVRAEICSGLAHLGIELNPEANASTGASIAAGPVEVLVVAADEELVMARQALTLAGTEG